MIPKEQANEMQKTLSSWVKVALCASILLLVGCGDGGVSGSTLATAPADPLAIQNISNSAIGTVCAVRTDGAARCWGKNAEKAWDQSKKGVTGPIKQLFVDSNFSCALNQADAVLCWGQESGITSLGRGALPDPGSPETPVAVLWNAQKIDTKNGNVCALTKDGEVYCWGGDIDDYNLRASKKPTPDMLARPTKIMGLPKIKQMSVGDYHSCAVGFDSSLWCWGKFDHGSDGTGRNKEFRSATPFRVEMQMGGATQVSAGLYFSCAVSVHSGSVYCWGRNDWGQTGTGHRGDNVLYPTRVLTDTSESVQEVSAGGTYACALLTSGAARCWGRSTAGALGNGIGNIFAESSQSTPGVVGSKQGELFGIKGIATSSEDAIASYSTTCAWGEGNQAWCWGSGELGQLGDNAGIPYAYTNRPKPVQVIESGWQ